MTEPDTRKILLIDNDLAARVVMSSRIRDAGFDVHLASDGESGLEVTRDLKPEVVLCDRWMPGVDGVEYCRKIKTDPDLRATYVAIVVTEDEREDMVEALDAGADDILLKPLDFEVLLAKVRAGMRAREIQRQLTRAQHRMILLQLAATLGHQINNPLTGILGHLELVAMYLDRGEIPRVRHHLDEAGRSAHRIGEVTYRLMAMADPKVTTYIGNQLMLDLEESVDAARDEAADALPPFSSTGY